MLIPKEIGELNPFTPAEKSCRIDYAQRHVDAEVDVCGLNIPL